MSGSAEAPPVEIAIELTKSPHADSQSKRGGGGDRLLTEVRGGLENADCCLMPGKGGDDLLKARIRKFMHTRPVNSVCFSPDGKKVATGSSDGFTRVFDVNSGKEIMKTIGLGVHVSSVCFSPDCKWVATGSWDGFARVFDVASSEEIMRTIKHGLWVESVCFSSDGKRIATGSWDKFARVFNVSSGVSSGEDILKTTEHGGKVTSVRFSHDGNSIATGCEDGFVRIFDVGSGKEIPKFLKAIKHGDAGVNSVCFSHDSKSVATGSSDGVARVFDVGSGQEILKAIKHGGNVTSVCVSPDGRRVVTGSEDKLARVFDVGSGKEILQSIQHGGKVTSVCFSPDGESVTTGSEDGFARIYDVGSEEAVLKAIAHGGKVTSICFSPDGKWVATGSEDKFARVFDVGSGKEVFKTIEHGGKVESVSFSYDGNRIATGGWDKLLRFFDVVSGEEMLKAIKHGGRVTSVCFSPDGSRVVTGSSDGFARVFDVGSGEEMLKTAKHGGHVVSVCFSPDGKSVATGSEDGFARVFDVKSGKEILKTIEHGIHVSSVCFSPDSKWVATGSSDSYARVFDVSSGNEIMRTIEHGGEILTVCYSSDGKSIVTGSLDGFARVFVIANRKQQKMQALKPCMIFPATNIAISSIHSIAVANDCNFQLLPRPMNFSSDFWLPVSPSIVLLWSCLSEDLQRQCFCSDSQVIVSEFWASEGGGLFALASKWQDLNFPRVLPTLKRLFDGEEPVVNAGLILRELLPVAGSKVLPNAEVVQALIRNVSRHASFAVHDSLLTEQLTRAACIPSIQSIVDEFWTSLVELVPSCPVVVHNVNHVSFSETSRMYVAGSESTSEQVFENHFKMRPQSKGSHLNFEHFLVPYPNASAHRDGSNAGSADATGVSLMQALVETNNIDVFGTVTVRAIVQHKWETFGFSLWIREFCIYSLGLAFLVALGILDWQNWELPPNDRDNAPPAIISVLFGVVIIRSFYRKMKEFLYSIPDGEGSLLKRILKSDQHKDFWSWLDLLHITLGMSVVALVWAQSPKALPVVAITSFLRWWGTLFFLQAFDKSGSYVRMLVEIVKAIRWFMLIMLISILATWNSFTLLLKRQCPEPGADSSCESSRNAASVFRTMYDMVNTLLFGSGDLQSLENTEYFGLVVLIFIISMVAMPIVLLNMLIAIMGDSYELIQDRSMRESVMMKATILLEIELFMSDADKRNRAFFPKFLHVIVPEGEAKAGRAEYQGLLNTLKRKMDENTRDTQSGIDKLQNELNNDFKQQLLVIKQETLASVDKLQKELKQETTGLKQEALALKHETLALKFELQGHIAEILQILRARPLA